MSFRSLRATSVLAGVVLLAGATLAASACARTLYVAKRGPSESGNVSVVNTASGKVQGDPIPIGSAPRAIAITPDGGHIYVTNESSGDVSVINAAAGKTEGNAIRVEQSPHGIAIAPNGRFAYVANEGSNSVSVINLATNAVEGVPGGNAIKVGKNPRAIAITPDGTLAYVVNGGALGIPPGVSVIDLATNSVVGGEIGIGANELPGAIAIAPDGSHAYVANIALAGGQTEVVTINLSTNIAEPNPIVLEHFPGAIAIAPDGSRGYVAEPTSGRVSVIDLVARRLVPDPIGVGAQITSLAVSPDGAHVYAATASGEVSVIDTATNELAPDAIPVGGEPEALAIAPDQPPVASFKARTPRARPGVPLSLDASASKDTDSAIATYAWDFGDRRVASLSAPVSAHTFARTGTYRVSLKETDAEGCSTPDTFLFTGQTAYCGGSAKAQVTKTIKVAYPGVRVRCPKSAGHGGCRFAIQVVASAPRRPCGGLCREFKPKARSALAKAKAKAGRSAIVSLKPTKAFRRRLAVARKVLVKETALIGGSKRTRFLTLKVVQ
jgi:YVTN family beta-propeller protein